MLEALKLLKECVYPFLLIHGSISLKSVQKELHGLNIHMRTGTLLRSILFRVISCHLICDGAKQVVSKVAAKMPPYLETWARNTPSFLDCWSPCWSRMQRQSMQPNASNTSATYESWPTSAQFSGFHGEERQLLCLCLLELLLQGDIPKVAKQAGREVRTQTIHFFKKTGNAWQCMAKAIEMLALWLSDLPSHADGLRNEASITNQQNCSLALNYRTKQASVISLASYSCRGNSWNLSIPYTVLLQTPETGVCLKIWHPQIQWNIYWLIIQWEFQDPKMEVLYHIRPYFGGIFPLYRPCIGLIYGRYLQFRFLEWPLIIFPTWKLPFHWAIPSVPTQCLGLLKSRRLSLGVFRASGSGQRALAPFRPGHGSCSLPAPMENLNVRTVCKIYSKSW